MRRLTLGPQPLLQTESGKSFRTPAEVGYTDAFRNRTVNLTGAGEEVLLGEHDWLASLPAPYWIGGARIADREAVRWDQGASMFRPARS